MARAAFGAPELGSQRLRIPDGHEVTAKPLNERVQIELRPMPTPLRLAIGADAVVFPSQRGKGVDPIHCGNMASHV